MEIEIPKDPTFVNFPCFSMEPVLRRLPASERREKAAEFAEALGRKRQKVDVRLYLGLGLRHDTDFFLWAATKELELFQTLMKELLATSMGGYLTLRHAFLGMTRPSAYNPTHIPAFEAGEAPRKYLFLYPFVKSREWYLLPFEKRREIMRGHMAVGEKYPMVRLNTTYSFGLGDQDFVLAFETDTPSAFEDLVQRLRESEASRYTVRDTPFILGTFCENGVKLMEGLGL